jgi:RNA polymerase sigma factor (sigma-70 family)
MFAKPIQRQATRTGRAETKRDHHRMTSVPDEDVMLQVRDGEVHMLGVLFDRYQAPLFNFYSKMTQDRTVSEDLVQEVFLRILRYRQTYRPGTAFRTWMYQIARNTRIDQVRKVRPESPLTIEPLAPTRASDDAERQQEAQLLQRALMQLPEDKREILVLSRFQEMKYDEIARLLGCETGAVKVRVHRALQQLREVYLALENNPAAQAHAQTQAQSQDPRRAASTDSLPPTGRVQ